MSAAPELHATVSELVANDSIIVVCPSCSQPFAASAAQLFDATGELRGTSLAKLNALRKKLSDDLATHEARVTKLRQRTKTAARVVNIGKVVEKIAPSLSGFPANPDECRSLFEPIDYLVFHGLARGVVERVTFVDLKSGRATLSPRQREIRKVVEAGLVTMHVVPTKEEP